MHFSYPEASLKDIVVTRLDYIFSLYWDLCIDHLYNSTIQRTQNAVQLCTTSDLSILTRCRAACRRHFSNSTEPLPGVVAAYGGVGDVIIDPFGFPIRSNAATLTI